MDRTFKGEYIPFFMRLSKRLAPMIILVPLSLFQLCYGRSAKLFYEWRIYFLIFLVICIIIGIRYHTNQIRTVVNEVRFKNNRFQIIGHNFNSKFEDSCDIDKIRLEIQLEEIDKNKTRYCLEIYFEDKYYYLNNFSDWEYSVLKEIVDEYKIRTNKIVLGMNLYNQLI